MMALVFWLSFLAVAYVYAGYPLILYAVSVMAKKKVKKGSALPKVSVILSAFNEEKAIERKILNLLDLDYPPDKLEILIGSDGASDETDVIVSKFRSPRVRFFRFVRNLGKPNVLNELIREAHGTVLLFTDARQELDRQAVRALVANFEDASVGCVSGELYFRATGQSADASVGEGMDAYWKYEKFMRKRESLMGSMLGATGAIYAIRRALYSEIPPDILVDDMYIPLSIIEKGYRAIFEGEACAYDQPSSKGAQEFKRKVRTLAGNFQVFRCFPRLLFSWKSPIAWQLFSHKFLRLMAPYFLILMFLTNLFLVSNIFYAAVFFAQVVFYGSALYESIRNSAGKTTKGIGYIPYTFCLLNYSAIVGLYKFLTGKQQAAWEKAYV